MQRPKQSPRRRQQLFRSRIITSFTIVLALVVSTATIMPSASSALSTATTSAQASTTSVIRAGSSPATTGTPHGGSASASRRPSSLPPPIVYTIAGSDSGGGAGIQADLHAMHALGCHGCCAVTCLTAQNSVGVTAVHVPPVDFLRSQLDALLEDMPPRAIKVGMLGSKELAEEVGRFLEKVKSRSSEDGREAPFVVVDPVMISTSGHRLINEDAQVAMVDCVFPHADILTPNKYEAEALLNRSLTCPEDVEKVRQPKYNVAEIKENGLCLSNDYASYYIESLSRARDILDMGVKSVLIKGGHALTETAEIGGEEDGGYGCSSSSSLDVNATLGFAQDYFLSEGKTDRLCDGARGIWLRTNRYDTSDTHGTGCTLSSAIASALAIGHQWRDIGGTMGAGAAAAIQLSDACCIAKAYVTAGIGRGVRLGEGPGPVVHTHFPSSDRHYPSIALSPTLPSSTPFLPMRGAQWKTTGGGEDQRTAPRLGRILPIVGTVEWVRRLARVKGVTDVQLRIKDTSDPGEVRDRVEECQDVCAASGVRLWVNDHWEAAIDAGCFGVHLGQEDLASCVDRGGVERIRECNLALGISTHSYAELSAALGLKPSYVSLGPIFGTMSKKVAFDPQGLATVATWRALIPKGVPLVAIGGIGDARTAKLVKDAGTDCVAVIGAVTGAADVDEAVDTLSRAMD